jgi:predicted RecB family endonuclease
VLEDLTRRERLIHPHSQFYFWRTAAGAEIDLVLERGSERFAIEVKAARADRPQTIRALASAAADVAATNACLIDQGEGHEQVGTRIERRGFARAVNWLPSR